ncbi:unnamed protein product [Aphanomyces euteiches]
MGAPEELSMANVSVEHEETEALSQSHKVLEQAYSVDSKSPDLVDQIADHSEPTSHNYFFEPYSSTSRGWQPQLVHKQQLLPYPLAITSAYENMRSGSFSGLLQEIHHAWVSVDNTLFLWDYTRSERLTAFEGMEQMITAVAIATPIAGVFKSFVKHILVVATASEMRLLVVLYENNDPVNGALRLQASKLCISTDDCTVKKIVTTPNGRIFFGGSDGQVHEFVYDAEETMLHQLGWKRKCRKESHSQSLSNYIPTIFRTLTGSLTSSAKIVDMLVDAERRILYVVQEPATISVYDVAEAEVKLVAAKDIHAEATRFCQRNHRTWTSCPEPRLFSNSTITITSLSVVGRDESASIHAVAVSSSGIRFYLSTFTAGFFSSNTLKRPNLLDVMHIRLPPPMLSLEDAPEYHVTEGLAPAILAGKSPSQVHKAYYRKGVFLAVDGGPDAFDSVIGLCQDNTARHNQDANATNLKRLMRESISADSCQGKVSDVQEYVEYKPDTSKSDAAPSGGQKRTFSEMNGSNTNGALPAEEPKAMLSELVSQFFNPPRRFLVLTNAGLHIFEKVRPLDQLSRILHSTGKELTAKLTHFVKCFGQAEICAMLFAIATEESSAITLVALQSIFEFGGKPGVAPSGPNPGGNSNSFILTDDMCMSYHHDGLVKFLARVLRPFWHSTSRVTSIASVRTVLLRLQSILATQYASALEHPPMATTEPSRFNSMTRALNSLVYESNPASLREENAIRAEQFSIRCLYRFTVRAVETLSLLVASYEHNASFTSPLPLAELVTTPPGAAACKVLIQHLMGVSGHSEGLVHQLRAQCPSLFADTDAAQSHGFQALEMAADCVTVHDQEVVLKKSLDHFRLASKTWTTEDQLSVLDTICSSYFAVGFLDGIVDLSLACARQLNKPDMANLRRLAYSNVLQCLHFFLLPNHDTLSICEKVPNAWTTPQGKEEVANQLLKRALASSDMQLHSVLYTWLHDNGQEKRLISLPSSHVETFLKSKDEELLIKQYLLQERYVDAAHILCNQAQEQNPVLESNRDVSQRLELMSRAASVLAAANNPAAANALDEVREALDVMQLQHNIWRTLEGKVEPNVQELKYRILDVSVLYNQYASKHHLWSDCLRIIRACNTQDPNIIQHLWEQILFVLIPKSASNAIFNQWIETKYHDRGTTNASSSNGSSNSDNTFESARWISHVQSQITPLGKELVGSSAFPVEFLLHELEHLWMWYIQLTQFKKPTNWITPFFIYCGVSYAHLFGVYNKLYENNQAPRWRFHLLSSIYDLVRTWQTTIQNRPSRETILAFATATPLLMSACEAYIVDLHALVGDGHSEKHHMIALFRQLHADVVTTKSTYT